MIKLVIISDTHGKHRHVDMPDGDILIHAGDISAGRGSLEQLREFNDWLGELKFGHIIVSAGNHDFVFRNYPDESRNIMSNAIVLIDEAVVIDGVKFYGSPWQPWFGGWCYNLPRGGALKEKWAMIHDDTDVLITHGPPYGILDVSGISYERCGCSDLLDRINIVKPKVSCFGHIHHSYGVEARGNTIFVNASICNEAYDPYNEPIVINIF